MMTTIQLNDRNVSYKSFDEKINEYVFIKESNCLSKNNPALENIPLYYFKIIDKSKCPDLVFYDSRGKLVLKYIDNHHIMRIGSKYFVENLESLGAFLGENYCKNNFEYISMDNNSLKYLMSNKLKWTKRISNVTKYVNDDECNQKLINLLDYFNSDHKCLCHGDLVFSNILCDKEHIVLVDYEYALLSTPEFDLSRMLSRLALYYYYDNHLEIFTYINALLRNLNVNLKLDKFMNYIGFHIFDYLFCHKHYDSLKKISTIDFLFPLAKEFLLFDSSTNLIKNPLNIIIYTSLLKNMFKIS